MQFNPYLIASNSTFVLDQESKESGEQSVTLYLRDENSQLLFECKWTSETSKYIFHVHKEMSAEDAKSLIDIALALYMGYFSAMEHIELMDSYVENCKTS